MLLQAFEPEFDMEEEVLKLVPPKGIPTKFTILERRSSGDNFEYKLADKQGTVYTERQGQKEICWFAEDSLEVA